MDECSAGARSDLRDPPDAVAAAVHETAEDGEQGRVDRVAVEHVQVVPAALGREVLQVQGDGGVGARGVYQPAAFEADGVVARAVMNRARGCAQPVGYFYFVESFAT